MIDHNLYTNYFKTGRLTLTKHLLYYNTIVLHKFTQHTLSLWLSQHSPFSSTMLIDRWHGKEGILYSQAKADNRVVTCVPHSREFINITRFSNLFITNSRVLYENIFLLPCGEYSRRLPCILPTLPLKANFYPGLICRPCRVLLETSQNFPCLNLL